jgi:thiazole synthase
MARVCVKHPLGPLFHCFGSHDSRVVVDTETAVAMLRTSGCRHLAINTHSSETVSCGDELPVGYGNATFGSVRRAFGSDELIPVLNINTPTSPAEAIARAHRAHVLTGERTVKLEVLDRDLRLSVNSAVVEVARKLVADGFDVWPLITPDPNAAAELEAMGCTVIRVMGSGIGSHNGIDPRWYDLIHHTLRRVSVPLMFDGGVGSPLDATNALSIGFDSVLVNSCLFTGSDGPVKELRRFVDSLSQDAGRPSDYAARSVA